jgi:hypothetical protein
MKTGPSTRRLALLATTLAAATALAQTPQPSRMLQTDLVNPLDISRLKLNEPIDLKVRINWTSPVCHLSPGAVLTGHVVDLHQKTKQDKSSSVSIAFDTAPCDGKPTPIRFSLFSLIAKTDDDGRRMDPDANSLTNTPTPPQVSSPTRSGGIMPSGGASAGNSMINADAGAQAAPIMNTRTGTQLQVIQPGQVTGLVNVTLSVGTGTLGSSVLSTPKGNIRLEKGSELILMYRTPQAKAPAASTAAPCKADPAPTPCS